MFFRFFKKNSIKLPVSVTGISFKYYAIYASSKNDIAYLDAEDDNFNSQSALSDGYICVKINGKKNQPIAIINYYYFFNAEEADDEIKPIAPIRYPYTHNSKFHLRYISPNELPYANEPKLDPKKDKLLKKLEVTRESFSSIKFRGDSLSYEEIKNAGGFHPKFSKENVDLLNVLRHRKGLTDSGFVSTTSDSRIAHAACADYQLYSVYALEVVGALGPSSKYLSLENEYSVPGGIDFDSIISFRKCKTTELKDGDRYAKCGNIFFNRKFAEKYPFKVTSIIQSQLFVGERVDEDSISNLPKPQLTDYVPFLKRYLK